MGKGYPVTIRKRLVEACHKEQGSIDELSASFGVHPDTVRRWLAKSKSWDILSLSPAEEASLARRRPFLARLIAPERDITQMQLIERLKQALGLD